MKTTYLLIILFLAAACQQRNESAMNSPMKYDEKFRPQYHFTPPSQWMNDPNGMVFYEGEYHLFYQHYPDSNVWGPMHWGHAVSEDMVHWEHLPIALYPDTLGYIFSGSAVIDWKNTSGLGTIDNPPMVAIYTYHDPVGAEAGRDDYQTQGIAFSLDKGRSWTKYEGNPVLANPGIIDFRDPKVSWDESNERWVMILAVLDHINIYTSPDLINWTLQSEFGHTTGGHGGVWECPDLFPLTDQNGEVKWVMLLSINPGGPQGGSATQYFVGDFNGSVFTPVDSVTRWIDYGADNYAGVTWADIPEVDGRRLFLGWMSNWQYANVVPTYEWRSAMTVPRALSLNKTEGGYVLQSKPVSELEILMGEATVADDSTMDLPTESCLVEVTDIQGQSLEITFSNDLGERLVVKVAADRLLVDRTKSGETAFNDAFAAIHEAALIGASIRDIQIYMDRSSVEVFVNYGEVVMTDLVFPSTPYTKVSVSSPEVKLSMTPMASIWR
ncbi:glycoside hydrolase family 32 protein [Marinoscillum sp.]|uniref:glycoside hydrolase family 32 protein n=1 Tax=Marinoscillum sp. TaxID=2024838 RepID=UPI003BA88647